MPIPAKGWAGSNSRMAIPLNSVVSPPDASGARDHCQPCGAGFARTGGARLIAALFIAAILLATAVPGGAQDAPAGAPPAAIQEFEPGEFLAADNDAWYLGHAVKLGFVPIEHVRLAALDLDVVRFGVSATDSTAADALRAFRAAFPSVPADFNAMVWLAAEPGAPQLAAVRSWTNIRSTCGAGIRLGMIDTPVEVSHAAFRGRDIVSRSFLREDRRPASALHGTAVAALLVGSPDSDGFGGLLPQATLLAANIFERRSWGRSRGRLFPLLEALDWLAGERVQVVNLSFETGRNTILLKALEKAARRNLVLTAAAGHRGVGAGPAYPAAHPDVLAATAIDRRLRVYRYAKRGDYIDFAAPGVRLWTAVPGGGKYQSGTSFAVPFVSAVAALSLAGGLQPDIEHVRQSLARTVRDLGAPGRDEVFGWGLLEFSADCD